MGSTGAEGGVDTSARIDEVAAPSPTTAARSAPLGGAGHAVARGDAVAPTRRRGALLADNPLVPLRRPNVGEAIDLGFSLFRFRFRALFGLAACLLLPLQLLDLVLKLTVVHDPAGDLTTGGPVVVFLGGSSAWAVVVAALSAVALSMLGIATGHLVIRLLDGEDTDFRELLGVALRRSWVSLVLLPLTLLIRVPLACIPLVGWVVADALVFVASIVAGAERRGPIAALGRNLRLTRAQLGPAGVLAFAGTAITVIIRLSLGTGPALLVSSLGPPEWALLLVEQLGSLVDLVAQPLTACIAAGGYLMLRTRVEGLDLEQRLGSREQEWHAPR